jgi:hypothetical protein
VHTDNRWVSTTYNEGIVKRFSLAGAAVAVVAVLVAACSTDTTSPTAITGIASMTPLALKSPPPPPPIKFEMQVTDADDVGTCNNTWALDSYKKAYTITSTGDGTYHLRIDYKDGHFVSLAGVSPGACEVLPEPNGNGNTVAAGITGPMKQRWDADFTGTPTPGANCDAVACARASGLLATLFTDGVFTTAFTYSGVYHAGKHGTWHDTWENWPFNDTGDII